MAIYTLCPEYFNQCFEDNTHYLNVFLKFCQINGEKLAFDKSKRFIEFYENKVHDKAEFTKWFTRLMTSTNNYEILDIDLNAVSLNSQELSIFVCENTFDRNLACNSKIDYLPHRKEINTKSINLIDKEELVIKLTSTVINVNNSTTGDNSPIVNGSDNQLN